MSLDLFEDLYQPPASDSQEAEAYYSLLTLRASSGARYFGDRSLQFPKPSVESRAFTMFEESFKTIQASGDTCMRDGNQPAQQIQELSTRLAELGEMEELFDSALSRLGQFQIPLYLKAVVDREVKRIEHLHRAEIPSGLGDPDNVRKLLSKLGKRSTRKVFKNPRLHNLIAVGPPRRFEIHIADLKERLKLHGAGDAISILTLPTLEGIKSPLWAPIVAGHEIAHLAFSQMRKFSYMHHLVEMLRGKLPDDLKIYADEHELFGAWLEELLCDLNAIRVYGPAGYAAIAEMLFVLESTDGAFREVGTHWQRLKFMHSALQRSCKSSSATWTEHVAPLVDPFKGLAQRPTEPLRSATVAELEGRRFQERNHRWRKAIEGELVSRALESCMPAIVDEMFGGNGFFRSVYNVSDRGAALDHVLRELKRGMPVEPLFHPAKGKVEVLEHADLINAMWREHLAGDPNEPIRERIQNIILHSCDAREFVAYWVDSNAEQASDLAIPPMKKGRRKDKFNVPYGRLSGRSIRRAIDENQMVFSPLIGNPIKEAGIDLRLGTKFITKWKSTIDVIDLIGNANQVRMMEHFVEIPWSQKFILHPGEFVLASTLEYIILPKDVTATVDSRSGFGRLGIQVAEALSVQPFTDNCITLELSNVGDVPLALVPGQAIAQFALTRFRFAEERPAGSRANYAWDIGPASSRFHKDADRASLRGIRKATRSLR